MKCSFSIDHLEEVKNAHKNKRIGKIG